jgi:4-carboxymuconolactone decarboxylase
MSTEFAYPDLDALSPDSPQAVTDRASPNIFRMIMHTPGPTPSCLAMACVVRQYDSLQAAWRKLVILRVGYRYRHERISRAIGLDHAINAAESGSTEKLEPDAAAILESTDLMLDNHTLTDAQRHDALRTLTANQLADPTLTVGFYQLVCNFLNTFGVNPEGEANQP